MSLHDAVHEAVQEVLRGTLAPELVDRLSDEILERARRGIEEGVTAFVGFEIGRGRAKAGPRAVGTAGRRRQASGDAGSEAPEGARASRADADPDATAASEHTGGMEADAGAA